MATTKDISLQTSSFHAGLATASNDGRSLTVVVLPKLWRSPTPKRMTRRWLWPADEPHQRLLVYENETALLSLKDCEPDDPRSQLVETLFDLCDPKSRKRKEKGPFLEPGVLPRRREDSDCEAVNPGTGDQKSLLALLALVAKAGHTDGAHPSAPHDDDMFLPLTQWRFVQELRANLSYLRRGYVPKTDVLAVVRGRVDAAWAARSQASGLPNVLCHFDEFTEGTPLVRVLVTALDQVCAGTWVGRVWPESFLGDALQNEASTLRRHLQSIPSVSPLQALQLARGVRFHRMTRVLEPAFRLAVEVLKRSSSLFARTGKHQEEAWLWSVDMSDVWERLVVKAFRQTRSRAVEEATEWIVHYDDDAERSAFFRTHPKQLLDNKVPPPWSELGGNRKPDILLRRLEKNWILDAKYKRVAIDSGLKEPGRDDQFQLFVYAHVTMKPDGNPWSNALGLVYPTTRRIEATKGPWQLEGHWPVETPRPLLHQLIVPFPNEEDCKSRVSWQSYLARAGRDLRRQLEEAPDKERTGTPGSGPASLHHSPAQ